MNIWNRASTINLYLQMSNIIISNADAVYSIPSTENIVTNPISIQSFTLKDIEVATENYKTLIGEGGFGSVYRGTLPDGEEVAVKVRSATSTQGTREFNNEVGLYAASKPPTQQGYYLIFTQASKETYLKITNSTDEFSFSNTA